MSEARVHLEEAVAEFRAWAAVTPEQFGEWECDYDRWSIIWTTFREFLQMSDPENWPQSMTEQLLYILARDNEMEVLKDNLIEYPIHLLALARAGLHSAEQDARWQLADALGTVQVDEGDVAPILETYVRDSDEYVSRRALLALGRRHSPIAETLARQAWDTGHEYQCIAALEVLSILDSPYLSSYLDLAGQDGRQYVVGAAQRIRSDR